MLGEVRESVLGCGEGGNVGRGVWESVLRCRGRCGEVLGEMWKSVLRCG